MLDRQGMHDRQAEMLLEGVEVAIAVKQGMPIQETESCDEAINCFADSMAARAEKTIILRGGYREFFSSG